MRSPLAVLAAIADGCLPDEGLDPVEQVRARFFVVGSIAIGAAIAVVSAVYAASPGVDLLTLLPILALLLPTLAFPFLLRRGVSLLVLGGALVVLIQCGLAWSATMDRGMDDVAFLWLVISPLFAALVGGARLAIVSVASAAMSVVGVLTLAETGYAFPNVMTPEFTRRYQMINVAGAAAVVATFAALYEGPLLARANTLAERLRTTNGHLRGELAARRKAQATAEAASRAKDALMANLSHEFRTPLTAVLGGLELLEDLVPEDDRELLALVGRGAHRLLATLTGVLDLVELESQAVTPAEPVEVAAVVADAVATARPAAEAKGLVLAAPERGGPQAQASPAALRRLVGLLLDNAVRFTERGGVGIEVRELGAAVEVAVWDTGIGMSSAFLARAGEPFAQASEGETRTHEGLGLGLAIATRLAESMDGTVAIESALGEGTTVRVQLPAAAIAPEPPEPPARAARPRPSERTPPPRVTA